VNASGSQPTNFKVVAMDPPKKIFDKRVVPAFEELNSFIGEVMKSMPDAKALCGNLRVAAAMIDVWNTMFSANVLLEDERAAEVLLPTVLVMAAQTYKSSNATSRAER
jgi:hypothetical protein